MDCLRPSSCSCANDQGKAQVSGELVGPSSLTIIKVGGTGKFSLGWSSRFLIARKNSWNIPPKQTIQNENFWRSQVIGHRWSNIRLDWRTKIYEAFIPGRGGKQCCLVFINAQWNQNTRFCIYTIWTSLTQNDWQLILILGWLRAGLDLKLKWKINMLNKLRRELVWWLGLDASSAYWWQVWAEIKNQIHWSLLWNLWPDWGWSVIIQIVSD